MWNYYRNAKFNVLGGVGLVVLTKLSLLSDPLNCVVCTNDVNFSMSIDLRFNALNVLVFPTMPVRHGSIGDIVNTTLSTDSGLKICWPVLVKLLRLEAVSDGVPAWLNTLFGIVGLKTLPTGWLLFGVATLFGGLIVLNTVVPIPLDSVLEFVCMGLVFADDVAVVVGLGDGPFAIGYRQNSWPSKASEDNCWRFWASRRARGKVNWTGSSSLKKTLKKI